jgi:hypothetical protein
MTTKTIAHPYELPAIALRCFTSEAVMRLLCSKRGQTIKHIWHLQNATNELWYCEVE